LLRHGGLNGIGDLSLIESAIARPYSGYYPSISQKAAALTHSLAKNHGFIDGNKRATLLTLDIFLQHCGYKLVGPDTKLVGVELSEEDAEILFNTEADAMILSVANSQMLYPDLVKWFRAHLRRRL
jgi:death on curing protein